MTDPRIQRLASETAQKIKAVANQYDADIQAIYQDYRQQAALIRAEASVESLSGSDTDPRSELYPQHQKY